MRKELLKGLTEEQIQKVRECGDVHDLLQLARDEGVELSEEQLNAVSGGACTREVVRCPICDSDDVEAIDESKYIKCTCNKCGFNWVC